jgi:hypothetical protein
MAAYASLLGVRRAPVAAEAEILELRSPSS